MNELVWFGEKNNGYNDTRAGYVALASPGPVFRRDSSDQASLFAPCQDAPPPRLAVCHQHNATRPLGLLGDEPRLRSSGDYVVCWFQGVWDLVTAYV